MRMKKIKVLRPEIQYEFENALGWFIFPFVALWVYTKIIRVVKVPVLISRKTVGAFWFLIVPKLKRADKP